MKITIIILTLCLSMIYTQGITNTLGGNQIDDKFIVENYDGKELLSVNGTGVTEIKTVTINDFLVLDYEGYELVEGGTIVLTKSYIKINYNSTNSWSTAYITRPEFVGQILIVTLVAPNGLHLMFPNGQSAFDASGTYTLMKIWDGTKFLDIQ